MYTTCNLVEYLVNLYSYKMNIANFFKRKKRKLNNISLVNEATAKKQHEERLNDFVGLDKVDVFCVKR